MNLQGKINLIKEAKDDIKSAIIAKGVTPSGNISTYANAISQIDTTNNQSKTVTENGVVRYDSGYTGLESVTVNVNQAVQDKNITENGVYTADSGYIGLGEVTVDVPFITEEITVYPRTTAQNIPTTVDGISEVHVLPVTASIDSDITANNIRNGVEILGVTGNIIELQGQTKSVSLVNSGTTIVTPDAPKNAITSVSITPNLQSKTVTSNGTVTADTGYCGLSDVEVDVDLSLQDKTFTANGTYSPDSGYNGFDNVTVNVNLSLQSKNITQNGTYTPDTGYNGFDSVAVNVQPNLQNKTITTNGSYTADSGYDGLGTVTVQTQSVNNTNLTVTENGTYTPSGNYTGYGNVTVNVPQSTISGSGLPRTVENGVYGLPSTSFNFSLPSNVEDLSNNALRYAFKDCTSLINIDLSPLISISGLYALSYAFNGCTEITNVDLSNLTTVSGNYALQYAFVDCTGITSVDLSSLTTVSGNYGLQYAFNNCTGITSVDLSNLTTLSGANYALGSAFSHAKITEMVFDKLEVISSYCGLTYTFSNTTLQTLSFPALKSNFRGSSIFTNMFNKMLNGVTGCTVHFPSNLQSVIGSWTDVTNGFGGTNTTVLFDLPATTTSK